MATTAPAVNVTPKLGYTIVFVSDMSRSVAFYRDAMGLRLKGESPWWSEFDTGATTLALHPSAPGVAPNSPADPTPPGAAQIGLNVDDIEAYHVKLVKNGVRCTRVPKLEEFGAKLAHYLDPDGLAITVSEWPKGAKTG